MCSSADLEATEDVQLPTEVHIGDMVALSGDQGVVCGLGPSGSDAPCVHVALLNAGFLEVPKQSLTPVMPDDEYFVFLKKESCSQLGLDVSPHIDCLEVTCIGVGLVQEWNLCSSPCGVVQVGDKILQVNGKTGQAKLLLDECKKSHQLLLRVRRTKHT
eukprot:symbB.v1.2.023822.t1/scaffold2199.1/size85959/3